MTRHEFELFADYFQVYLQDDDPEIGNLADAWTPEAAGRLLAVAPGAVGIGTVRNMNVPVAVEVHDAEPEVDLGPAPWTPCDCSHLRHDPLQGRMRGELLVSGLHPTTGKAPGGETVQALQTTDSSAGKQSSGEEAGIADDKRLERLFDYTKWHIGIYLTAGGGLVALLGSADRVAFLRTLVGSPKAMLLSLIAMAVAGLSGGVLASGATQSLTFDALWNSPQGPLKSKTKLMPGRRWAWLEHYAFWASLSLFAYSILSAPAVMEWIWK